MCSATAYMGINGIMYTLTFHIDTLSHTRVQRAHFTIIILLWRDRGARGAVRAQRAVSTSAERHTVCNVARMCPCILYVGVIVVLCMYLTRHVSPPTTTATTATATKTTSTTTVAVVAEAEAAPVTAVEVKSERL